MFVLEETIFELNKKTNSFEPLCIKNTELGKWYNLILPIAEKYKENCEKLGYREGEVDYILASEKNMDIPILSSEYYKNVYPNKPEQNESKRKWEYTRYADTVIKVKEEY